MTEYKELAARAEKYLDLGMRMGQMSDSASNIYRIAADLLICAKSQQARIEALEAANDALMAERANLIDTKRQQLSAAEARCKRLEEALRAVKNASRKNRPDPDAIYEIASGALRE